MTLTLALHLCSVFGLTSLLAFGGGNVVIPEFEHLTVGVYHWLTPAQFTDSFAIAQAAPGPSTLIVSLLGYRAGGVWAALIATAAMVVPTACIVYGIAKIWDRGHGEKPWRHAFQDGLAPITVGLILAGGVVVAKQAEGSLAEIILTVAATLVLCTTRINPLIVAISCGIIGYVVNA